MARLDPRPSSRTLRTLADLTKAVRAKPTPSALHYGSQAYLGIVQYSGAKDVTFQNPIRSTAVKETTNAERSGAAKLVRRETRAMEL